MDRILRIEEVRKVTGYSNATIYRLMKDGKLPKNVKLSTRAVGWFKSDIEQWLDSRRNKMAQEV